MTAGFIIAMILEPKPADRAWTASSLRMLTPAERDATLSDCAAIAESEYCSNPQLIDFEAFGEDDLHGQSRAVADSG